MVIYKDKISTIEYDEESHNVTYLENGLANRDLLLGQHQSVLDFSENARVTSVIADFRKLQGSFKSVFEYLNHTYYPTLKSRGLVCKAFIVSDDIINNHLTNLLVKDLKRQGIEAALFTNTKAAGKWVKTCTNYAHQKL